ncbi:uncharacterized protein TrAtP1_006360 [Trichoderma atroviride]|uniref:uncharacterized protein n=1 Tax=Hypocrea atroviridis TaxID=63577 RepID=UPI00331E1EED|nr:hypothetical protein TrAtP1_006360 [Trichoderma atroviride]
MTLSIQCIAGSGSGAESGKPGEARKSRADHWRFQRESERLAAGTVAPTRRRGSIIAPMARKAGTSLVKYG